MLKINWNNVLLVAGLSLVINLQAAPGDILWKFNAEQTIESAPVIDTAGNLYFGSDDQHIWSIDAKGNKRWAYPLLANMQFSPVLGTDGTVYLDVNDPGSHDGTLYAFNESGNLLWSNMITQDPNDPNHTALDVGFGPLTIGLDGNLYMVITYLPKGESRK